MQSEANSAIKVYDLHLPQTISAVYFLDLRLHDSASHELSRNFYWLSTKPDELDYDARVEPWPFYTPSKAYSDFTLLNSLPLADFHLEEQWKEDDVKNSVCVIIRNKSPFLAFFIELSLLNDCEEMILPVFWQDNYFSLLPGEERSISGWVHKTSGKKHLQVKGWNC